MHTAMFAVSTFAFPFNIFIQKPISFREPSPKIPFQIPYLKKQISLPQLQEKEVKVQILVSSQKKVVNEVTQSEVQQ